jgi:alanyl-tRNA synthetase
MTDRLYYTDPYLRTFEASVERVDTRGGRIGLVLDRTAFYPTSGGQPFDLGTVDDWRVVEVEDEEDGSVVHLLEPATTAKAGSSHVPEAGAAVRCEIDWPRRFDHMQQHTGQHVLSAAFVRTFDVPTVSFHLGAEVSTIDLARELAPPEIARAEDEANRIVWQNRPVAIRFASRDEASRLPLRKEPRREGTLRLIEVEDWDLSACGGTHVSRTGEIGVITIAGWERFKGGQRLEFLCGGRAVQRFRRMRETLASGVRLLSVLPEELPASIERLQAEIKDQKRAATALQGELAQYRAAELAATAESGANGRLVARVVDADANGLKTLATTVCAADGFAVVLVSAATPSVVVVARSSDVAVSAQQVLSALVAQFGGRGGGRPELAQGGGLAAAPGEIVARAKELLH